MTCCTSAARVSGCRSAEHFPHAAAHAAASTALQSHRRRPIWGSRGGGQTGGQRPAMGPTGGATPVPQDWGRKIFRGNILKYSEFYSGVFFRNILEHCRIYSGYSGHFMPRNYLENILGGFPGFTKNAAVRPVLVASFKPHRNEIRFTHSLKELPNDKLNQQ